MPNHSQITYWTKGSVLQHFGGTSMQSAGDFDAFLTKLAPNTGNVIWAINMGGSGLETGFGVATNGTDIYVTGGFSP